MLAFFPDIPCHRRVPARVRFPAFWASLITSACDCAIAAMNASRESRIACCMGSAVLPSKTVLLMTVSIRIPRRIKLPHGVGYVLVVAPQAIHPTHHQRVSLPEVGQSPPFRTFTEASGEARNTVSQHQIRFKSDLVGVGSLMIECLIDGYLRDNTEQFSCSACVSTRVSPARGPVRRCLPGVCGRESQGLFNAPKALPLRA